MYSSIIEKLVFEYNEKGFLSEDEIFDTLLRSDASLMQIEQICSSLMQKGVVILSKEQTDFSEQNDDRSHIDYDLIYDEIISIDESLEYFIGQVRNIKPPQNREFNNLFLQAKEGNEYAKQRILEMYLKLAIKQALWYNKHYNLPIDDAIQDACIGLIMAYQKYDINIPESFSTYTGFWLRNYISRGGQPVQSLIRWPEHYKEKMYLIYELQGEHFCSNCKDEYICENLINEIANKLTSTRNEAKSCLQNLQELISLDEMLDNEELSIFNDEANEILLYENRMYISQIMNILSEREKGIIELRYGLRDGREYTLEEIGVLFNVTRERIRQIESKALRKLKASSKTKI